MALQCKKKKYFHRWLEIPLHSRVQSHASSLRPGGGGLSGFKCEYSVQMLRWYCKNEPSICRVRTEAGGEREREKEREVAEVGKRTGKGEEG